MAFIDLLKRADFWKHTLRIAFMFIILMTVISLLFNNFSDILAFDMKAVAEKNFTDGKWVRFFAIKAVIGILYSGYLTSKNMK